VTDGRLVLVSGRDDHGLLTRRTLPLRARPVDGPTVGRVANGTLARVVDGEGQWLEIETVEGPVRRGWIDDFFLRGVVHLVGPEPSCKPRIDGRRLDAGEQAVVLGLRNGAAKVQTVNDPQVMGWVPRRHVQELPPGSGCEGHHAAGPRADHHHGEVESSKR